MRFLIVNTDYPAFLCSLYAKYPGLEHSSYQEQMRVRMASLFGVADFLSGRLHELGHEAWDVHANNEPMQKTWASEHNVSFLSNRKRRFWKRRPDFPWMSFRFGQRPIWMYEVLAAQVKHYKPDVLLNQAMVGIDCRFMREMKPYVRLLLGQHAATRLPEAEDFGCYDLILSSFPPTVNYFREKGISAELSRLGFEPKVLTCLKDGERTHDVTFVGSFLGVHNSRVELINAVYARLPQMRIWGPEIDHIPATSSIRGCYAGQAWGRHMYQILRKSKITVNHHGNVPPYANNMRLFEATGVGTLLVTDWKENLAELFEPDKEVVAYRSPEECVELIQHYLDHDQDREAIARAGQKRTLSEHTWHHRMQELVDIVHRYL